MIFANRRSRVLPEQETSFGDILNQFEQTHTHESAGEPGREATVVAIKDDTVFFDIGQKTEGTLPASALRDEQGPIPVKPGDVIHVSVNGRNSEGYYQLSLIHGLACDRRIGPVCRTPLTKSWRHLRNSNLGDQGRLLAVDVGVRAFMPASRSVARDVPEMQTLVGQQFSCRVIKLDTEKEDASWLTGGRCSKKSAPKPKKKIPAPSLWAA